jgi:hypothetical protein
MTNSMIDALVAKRDKIKFLLDCGAFTAWKSGKPIHLDDYCRFLDSLPIKPWKYFALDVVGDPVATMRNYRIMLDRGYKPMPVFTPNQEYADIDEYYKTADLIGCGGLTDKYGSKGLIHLTKVFKHVRDRPIHLLGYTKPAFIKHFKPYSCDSSSWSRSQRYGLCDIWYGNGEYVQLTRRDAANKPSQKVMDSIRRLGFSVGDLAKEMSWRGSTNIAQIISARTWVKYMIEAQKNINTSLFLAMGDKASLNRAMEAWDYWHAPSST